MNKMLKKVYFFLNNLVKKIKFKRISYSLSGVDLIVNYIFKNRKIGFYIDVGCNHPIKNNNTFLLYKKGWSGINIDLDKSSIEQFNFSRPNDENLNVCISDKTGISDFFTIMISHQLIQLIKKLMNIMVANIKKLEL